MLKTFFAKYLLERDSKQIISMHRMKKKGNLPKKDEKISKISKNFL